jgi:hypothetical protein
MNIGAFFGGAVQFTQTCFERNNHFLVALILEFSTFVASDNYVDQEISQVCSGEDAEEGPGRLSVEQPGSLCFNGGEECLVDCLPNANDSPVCQARQAVGTSIPSPSPTSSGASDTLAPTLVSTTPQPSILLTDSPSARPAGIAMPTLTPITSMPNPQPMTGMPVLVPSLPTEPPISIPSLPTSLPITRPTLSRPTLRPPPGSEEPAVSEPPYHRPPVYQPPTCTGKGICYETSGSMKESKSRKSSKIESSGKGSKSDGKGSNIVYDDGSYDDDTYDDDDQHYGIGNHNAAETRTVYHQQEEQNIFRGIGDVETGTVLVEDDEVSKNR